MLFAHMNPIFRFVNVLVTCWLLAPALLHAQETNLALNKPSAASTYQSGFPPKDAFDGNTTNTRWGSEYNTSLTSVPRDSNYVYVDLQGTAILTRVDLYWESAYATDFKLEVSSDAVTWQPLFRVSNNTSKTNSLAVAGTGRYVRMHGLKRALPAYGYSLWEFQVFGTLQPAPLPVTLVSFYAERAAGAGGVLRWTTASEVNSARFEVERSQDGLTFEPIGTVAAAGTSATTRTYTFTDARLPATALRYYRLRQLDANGTATYSPVRTVAPITMGFSLYPNPAAHTATLSGASAGASVHVIDALGRVVLTTQANEAGSAALALPAGLYLVRSEAGQALRLVVE